MVGGGAQINTQWLIDQLTVLMDEKIGVIPFDGQATIRYGLGMIVSSPPNFNHVMAHLTQIADDAAAKGGDGVIQDSVSILLFPNDQDMLVDFSWYQCV